MIEKIDINQFAGLDTNSKCSILYTYVNELVDAVNGILDYAPLEMAMKAEPQTPAENVQVDEIEQAEKWIGKLCWFSQIYECHQHIAILKRISESGLYVTDDGELHYAYCEPVKPDDNIIYKGE